MLLSFSSMIALSDVLRFNSKFLSSASLVAVVLTLAPSTRASSICSDAFSEASALALQTQLTPKREETILDLFSIRENEIANLSSSTIRWMNKEALSKFQNESPPPSATQARLVDFSSIFRLNEITREHVVVASEHSKKYSPEEVDIGYCFGRAMYVHLMLRKMGLQEKSIRKVWALGPIRSPHGDLIWSFHVATAVYTPDGWMTIDPLSFKPEPVRHWLSRFDGQSVDGRMRFYVTEASKFGPALGKYNRAQLGLDLKRDEDWYRHFFPDMLTTIREAKLETLGLHKLAPDASTPTDIKNESVWQAWKRLFGL
jgi:hypothetical protein